MTLRHEEEGDISNNRVLACTPGNARWNVASRSADLLAGDSCKAAPPEQNAFTITANAVSLFCACQLAFWCHE